MGLQYRTIRAAATALLVALAIGAGGTTGISSAVAAEPGMVALSGTLVDAAGTPLGRVHLVITETAPDDAFAGFQAITASDGSFSADVYSWGTAEAPATISFLVEGDLQVVTEGCSRTWAVAIDAEQDVSLSGAAPEPVALHATTTLMGEACGVTGGPSGGNAGGGAPGLTPPPTERLGLPGLTAGPGRLGPALTLGFMVGLLAGTLLLLPRLGARRRD